MYELAKRGYDAQGNEFSYYMLLFSSFMLNATREVGELGVCPWMHGRSNHRAGRTTCGERRACRTKCRAMRGYRRGRA